MKKHTIFGVPIYLWLLPPIAVVFLIQNKIKSSINKNGGGENNEKG